LIWTGAIGVLVAVLIGVLPGEPQTGFTWYYTSPWFPAEANDTYYMQSRLTVSLVFLVLGAVALVAGLAKRSAQRV
jgi:hypothetical protein